MIEGIDRREVNNPDRRQANTSKDAKYHHYQPQRGEGKVRGGVRWAIVAQGGSDDFSDRAVAQSSVTNRGPLSAGDLPIQHIVGLCSSWPTVIGCSLVRLYTSSLPGGEGVSREAGESTRSGSNVVLRRCGRRR